MSLWLWCRLAFAESQRLNQVAGSQLTHRNKNSDVSQSGTQRSACPGHFVRYGPNSLEAGFHRKPGLSSGCQEGKESTRGVCCSYQGSGRYHLRPLHAPKGKICQGKDLPREPCVQVNYASIMLPRALHHCLWSPFVFVFMTDWTLPVHINLQTHCDAIS